ncbi:hypothetical protein CPC16_002025 [Podila verticillata]|nr:hypothetical protein CPC16_002025 [Podila verticillata]
MAPCPLCSQPIVTYRIRLTSDDELTMCCNDNCMYPFHDKETFRSCLVIQKSAKVAKKRKQDASEVDNSQSEPIKAVKTTQPPKLTTGPIPNILTTNKDLIQPPGRTTNAAPAATTSIQNIFMPAIPNTSACKNPHVALPPTKSTNSAFMATSTGVHLPILNQVASTASPTPVDPLAFLFGPNSPLLDPSQGVPETSFTSSSSSPTALPPLSAASSPDMSLDFLDSDSWMMPTTPPSLTQTMNQPKQTDTSSSMSDQSIRDLLFDDFDTGSEPHMQDFGSLMLDLDDTSLDALLGGMSSV